MKNIIKMSLVAAVAVAGLSTSAAAVDTTTFSGKVYVENTFSTNDTNDANATTAGQSVSAFDIDFDLTAKTKITDTLTAVVRVQADTGSTEKEVTKNETVTMDNVYFAYANNGVSAMFGKQDIKTPNTDGEKGEGLVASYTMGSVTAVGAHFSSNGITSVTGTTTDLTNTDISALALLGTTGPVNFELWNVGVQNHSTNMTAVVSGKVAGLSLSARYATTDFEDAAEKDGVSTILSASGTVANIKLGAKYITSDTDNAAFVTDNSSANTVELVNFVAGNKANASAYMINASMPITDTLTGAVKYGTIDYNANDDANEVVVQLSYAAAKSTTITARYADYTETVSTVNTDKSQARIDVTYKF